MFKMQWNYEKQILEILSDFAWHSPKEIGHKCGRPYTNASSWASPKCKMMVAKGLLDRNNKGHYRIKTTGIVSTVIIKPNQNNIEKGGIVYESQIKKEQENEETEISNWHVSENHTETGQEIWGMGSGKKVRMENLPVIKSDPEEFDYND